MSESRREAEEGVYWDERQALISAIESAESNDGLQPIRLSVPTARRILAALEGEGVEKPDFVISKDDREVYVPGQGGYQQWLHDTEGGRDRFIPARILHDSPGPRGGGLEAVIHDFLRWADETFPDATPETCIAHLRSEVEELSEDGGARDPEELADAAMLIFHAAHKGGIDLTAALRAKLEKNRKREWGPPNEEGYREHIKPDAAPAEPTEEDMVQIEKARERICNGEGVPLEALQAARTHTEKEERENA